jgi:hypothetical protein
MVTDDEYDQWAHDGHVLAQIGSALYRQRTVVQVRIPRQLAESALVSWERQLSGEGLHSPEDPGPRAIIKSAATLAFIGRSMQRGGVQDNDDVLLDLDAWDIGHALNAAEMNGLLEDLGGPRPGF